MKELIVGTLEWKIGVSNTHGYCSAVDFSSFNKTFFADAGIHTKIIKACHTFLYL